MSNSVFTAAGRSLIADCLANGTQLGITELIFADIPDLDTGTAPDPEMTIAPETIVHRAVPTAGLIDDKTAVYSAVIEAAAGDFYINAMAILAGDTVVAIAVMPRHLKWASTEFRTGNSLVKNFAVEVTNIADLTGITIAAAAWQFDFDNRYVKRDSIVGKSLFDLTWSLSTEPPPGAMSLHLGTLIPDADQLLPEFYAACVERAAAGKIRALTEAAWQDEVAALGQTGAFVVDTAAKSIRLPKINRFVRGIDDEADLGAAAIDTIRNMTGHIPWITQNVSQWSSFSPQGVFKLSDDRDGGLLAISEVLVDVSANNNYKRVMFDASQVVPTGDEVAPKNVQAALFIQVATTGVNSSLVDWGHFVSLLEGKADNSLASCPENLDFVVDSWRAADGNSWYRLYRSGFVEQGVTVARTSPTITWPVEFADADYTAGVTALNPAGSASSGGGGHLVAKTAATATAVTYTASITALIFYACGQAAATT